MSHCIGAQKTPGSVRISVPPPATLSCVADPANCWPHVFFVFVIAKQIRAINNNHGEMKGLETGGQKSTGFTLKLGCDRLISFHVIGIPMKETGQTGRTGHAHIVLKGRTGHLSKCFQPTPPLPTPFKSRNQILAKK